MVQIRSNDRSPPISDRMTTVTVAGLHNGSRTCQKAANRPAPSTVAASKYSRGIDTIPAM